MSKSLIKSILITAALIIASSAAVAETINVAPGGTNSFKVSKVALRYLSANPQVANIDQITQDQFRVKGVGEGSTFVYIWWKDGGFSAIKVVSKPVRAAIDPSFIKKDPLKQDGFKVSYSNTTYNGYSDSQYANNRWSYTGAFNSLTFSGNTFLGNTNSYVLYENYNDKQGVVQFSLNMAGDGYYAAVGDQDINFSDITLPYMHYQGAYIKTSALRFADITIAGGARGSGYWGREVVRDTRQVSSFMAARASMKPFTFLDIDLSYVAPSTEANDPARNIIGAGFQLRPVSFLSLGGEVASNRDLRAYQAQAVINLPSSYLKTVYKSVPSSFETPSDAVNNRGIEGFFVSGSTNPVKFFRLSGEYNQYRNSYLQTAGNGFQNQELRINSELIFGPQSSFIYSPWKQDHRGYVNGGVGEGTTAQINYCFDFLGKDRLYARYEPSKFTMSNSLESDYLNDKTLVGIMFGLNDSLNLIFENETNQRTSFLTSSVDNSALSRIQLDYSSNMGKTPLYTIIRGAYESGSDSSGSLVHLRSDVELGYQTSEDLKVYARARTESYQGSAAAAVDRSEKHFNFGVKMTFDSSRRP